MQPFKVGVIGGSGLYELDSLKNIREERIETPFGSPSDVYICGKINDTEVVFLPRHGRGHRLLPSEIPFRANLWGMKSLGVTHLISVGAVGSLREEIAPGHIVFPDQFIDRTSQRVSTFFGDGVVAHVPLGDPICSEFKQGMIESSASMDVHFHHEGTYVCMEGPAFSTRAESELYRSWGASVIGMTNLQEAKLAREVEMCFANIALATDYDCWHQSEESVTVEQVVAVMKQNVQVAKQILEQTIQNLPKARTCGCAESLKYAILTAPDAISAETRERMSLLIGKYM